MSVGANLVDRHLPCATLITFPCVICHSPFCSLPCLPLFDCSLPDLPHATCGTPCILAIPGICQYGYIFMVNLVSKTSSCIANILISCCSISNKDNFQSKMTLNSSSKYSKYKYILNHAIASVLKLPVFKTRKVEK